MKKYFYKINSAKPSDMYKIGGVLISKWIKVFNKNSMINRVNFFSNSIEIKYLYFIVMIFVSIHWSTGQTRIEYDHKVGSDIDMAILDGQDALCPSGAPSCTEYTNCSYQSYLQLEVGPLTNFTNVSLGIYELEITVSGSYIDNLGNPITISNETLQISYSRDGGQLQNIDVLILDGGYDMSFTVDSYVLKLDGNIIGSGEFIDAVKLSLYTEYDRFRSFQYSNPVTFSDITYTPNGDQISLSWSDNGTVGVEEYELEWTWVDSDLIVPIDINNSSTYPIYNFSNNANRVRVNGTTYLIPNLYRSGYIVARIRYIGRSGTCDNYRHSAWSLADEGPLNLASMTPPYYEISGHLDHMNWSRSTAFAEDSKKKHVVNYYDGIFKQRQILTKLESDDHLMVSENFYDHVGRPSLSVLPSPIFDATGNYVNTITYQDNVNFDLNGDLYSRINFEKDNCYSEADELSSSSGSAKYYSPDNPIKTNEQAYVPDAENYPLVQTIFTQDGTGRVRSQSGVGPVHQLGADGQNTKYYYLTPSQSEIDRLFGNNVGYAKYYQEQMVVDPNGQVSVSYMDNKGRTIATALAGNSPDQLDGINTQLNPVPIVNELIEQFNSYEDKELMSGSSNVNKQFVAKQPQTNVAYVYNLQPSQFEDEECADDLIFDCSYDINFAAIDDCGAALNFIDPISNVTQVTDASSNLGPLDIGQYTIAKSLSLNLQQAQLYEDQYVEDNNCIVSLVELFQSSFLDIDFESCIDQVCFDDCITQINAIDPPITELQLYKETLLNCINDKVDTGDCSANQANQNSCEDLRAVMIEDMLPFGQYGTITLEDGTVPDDGDGLPCSSIYSSMDYGGIDYLSTNDITITEILEQPDVEDYVETNLLQYHPEYCYLLYCEFIDDAAYNDAFEATETFDEAWAAGYLNPFDLNANKIGYYGIDNYANSGISANPDPFKSSYSPSNPAFPELFTIYISNNSGTSLLYSLWDVAFIAASGTIIDVDDFWLQNNTNPGIGTWDTFLPVGDINCYKDLFWQYFKALYLQAKNQKKYGTVLTDYLSNFPCASVDACIDDPAFIKRFVSPIADPMDNDYPLNNNDPTPPTMETICEINVQSLVASWADELSCLESQIGETAFNDLLVELEDFCMENCDITHPYGATTNPDNTNSFAIIIEEVFNSNSITIDESCNPYLITSPDPYTEFGIFGGEIPILEDCNCSKYNEIYTQSGVTDVGQFYTYLTDHYGISYSITQLTQLDCACRVIDSDFKLEKPIVTDFVPYPFACTSCVTCPMIKEIYLDFTISPHNVFGTIELEDFEKESFQTILTNYFNQALGFNLSYREYFDFLAFCNADLLYELPTANRSSSEDLSSADLDSDRRSRNEGDGSRSVSVNEVSITLTASTQHAEASDPITYTHTISNTTSQSVTLDLTTNLPDGWTLTSSPATVSSGTLNSYMGESAFSYTGIVVASGSTVTFDADVMVSPYIFVAKNYYAQSQIPDGEEYILSDYIVDNDIDDEPTPVYINMDDPCVGSQVEAADMVVFLDDVVNYAKAQTQPIVYPLVIPIELIPSFDQVNMWSGSYAAANISLKIDYIMNDPTQTTFQIFNYCGVDELICEFVIDDLPLITEIDFWRDIKPTASIYNPHPQGYYTFDMIAKLTTGADMLYAGASSCYSFTPCELRQLCNRPAYFEIELTNDCMDNILDIAAYEATRQYNMLIDNSRERFRLLYPEQCMSDVIETFDESYDLNEYHYTLYYYDQSGSLIQTIPPKGVVPNDDGTYLTAVKAHRADPSNLPAYPTHQMPTNYEYNSFNNVIINDAPDIVPKQTWYDRLGRPIVSQDGRQDNFQVEESNLTISLHDLYTYMIYDKQGRIIETGEIEKTPNNGNPMTDAIAADGSLYADWLANNSIKRRVTRTIYDEDELGVDSYFGTNYVRRYLRKRIADVIYYEELTGSNPDYRYASHYEYDVHGNVKTLIQEYKDLESIGQSLKRIDYIYDLVSGNVHEVQYQHEQPDAFYHRYSYDEDNRLLSVVTSHDRIIWDQDATYIYYDHGPLARMELGEHTVQGLDYTYTLHGWIKGVNSNTLIETRDPGGDGRSTSINSTFAADAFGYSLGYYSDDYKAIATIQADDHFLASEPDLSTSDLYNGNISRMATSILKPDGMLLDNMPSAYTYDQLHRIKSMTKYDPIVASTNTWANTTNDQYKTNYTYDPNGNIIDLERRDETNLIDDLSYVYYDDSGQPTNKLSHIIDPAGASQNSVGTQAANNYTYDKAGNLIKDVQEYIRRIDWDHNGKLRSIQREINANPDVLPNIVYDYDGMGNRIRKYVKRSAPDADLTYYIRDASGNIMATYETTAAGPTTSSITALYEKDYHLYGSSRLGIKLSDKPDDDLNNYTDPDPDHIERIAGLRRYELSNHLGNVLSTISDHKLYANAGSMLPTYKADILSYSDYYPFGWEMPGRADASSGYRYGFNGKEKDDEVGKGGGAQYDYGFRIYDTRIAKFLSVDPLTSGYPWYTPYQFAGNKPIWATDLDGLEEDLTTEDDETYSGGISDEVTISAQRSGTQGNTQTERYGSSISWSLYKQKYNLEGWSQGSYSDYWEDVYRDDFDKHAAFKDQKESDRIAVEKMFLWMGQVFPAISTVLSPSFTGGIPRVGGLLKAQPSPRGLNLDLARIRLKTKLQTDDLAFGLNSNLNSFAKKYNFKTYREFTSGGFKPLEIEAAILNPRNNLHFNLEGFSRYRFMKFDATAKPSYNNITNWELNLIGKKALSRTKFYNSRGIVETPYWIRLLSK